MSEEKSVTPTDAAEPAWIRDTQATVIGFDEANPNLVREIPMMVAAIYAGETVCCEYCGKSFPMWPMKFWADHQITEHGAGMTIQVRAGNALLCGDEIGPAQQALFNAHFASRTSMRRRAWQLGYFVELKPQAEQGRIHLPS